MNTLNDLLSGHFKNSYGVEGMDITGRSDWKRIVPVSDEMKKHVLEDVKKDFYKYGGMSGGSKSEDDAYYDKIHSYIKSANRQDRSAIGWTLSQLHLDIANEVNRAVKEKVPGWTPGQKIPSEVLDEIFASERITSIVSGKSSAAEGIMPRTDSVEISEEGRLALEQEKAIQPASAAEDDATSENRSGGKVGINAGKLARMLAAAKTRSQVQAVMAKIQADLKECDAGKEQGMDVDEASVQAAEQLLQEAKSRMGNAENREATPEEELASALAGLM